MSRKANGSRPTAAASELLTTRRKDGKIWSHIRKTWLEETPEEGVRQESGPERPRDDHVPEKSEDPARQRREANDAYGPDEARLGPGDYRLVVFAAGQHGSGKIP